MYSFLDGLMLSVNINPGLSQSRIFPSRGHQDLVLGRENLKKRPMQYFLPEDHGRENMS